jgi:hypothetical protein
MYIGIDITTTHDIYPRWAFDSSLDFAPAFASLIYYWQFAITISMTMTFKGYQKDLPPRTKHVVFRRLSAMNETEGPVTDLPPGLDLSCPAGPR